MGPRAGQCHWLYCLCRGVCPSGRAPQTLGAQTPHHHQATVPGSERRTPPRVQLPLNWAENGDKRETLWGRAQWLHLPWKLGCQTREALKGQAKRAKGAENKPGPTRKPRITPHTPTGSPPKVSQMSPTTLGKHKNYARVRRSVKNTMERG